jgi:phenylacetate-CoA ligase
MNGKRDFYGMLVSGLLFPLHERLKRHSTVAVRKWLEQTQHYPQARLKALQAERLQALIHRAARKVPYYQEVFATRGLDASAIRTARDLPLLPFLTKDVIRRQGDRLRAADAGRLALASTSGSTGEPLRFWLGMERISHDVAAKWRATRWWGVDIGDPEVVIWASPAEVRAQDRLRRLRDRMLRSTLVNATDLSEPRLDAILEAINRADPRMLFGYTAAIARLARHILYRGRSVKARDLRVAFVTTEKLLEEQRRDIAAAFGCPVANGYGGRDAGFIAHECPAGGMHITAEDVVVEIVDAAGNPLPIGEAGEVVVTHLASGDFPFIRYRTGDIAVLDGGQCPCGRSLPLIRDIQGRANDMLVGAGGQVMHYTGVSHLLRGLPGLHTFKVIQESLFLVRVLVVAEPPLTEAQAAGIREGLRRRLGPDVIVVIEQVADIPLERSGKHRHVICRIPRTAWPPAAEAGGGARAG